MKSMFRIIAVLFFIALAIVACKKDSTMDDPAQPQQEDQMYELGLILLPAEEYAKLPLAKTPALELKAMSAVVNLNTLPVGNQGGEGSCVAWGTTYAGRSDTWILKYPAPWSTSVNIFSPEYVYNQIKVNSDCGSGAYVLSALNLLKSEGVCTWASMPYTDVSCSLEPSEAQVAEAATYKISKFATVTRSVTDIKSFLASGYPVIVGGPVDRNFMNLKSGAVLTKRKGSLGGHCYCVVGYDDTKNAFKFQNSWGTSWASAGFGWIDYRYISSWWTELYVIYN